jgi:hypothetical protein
MTTDNPKTFRKSLSKSIDHDNDKQKRILSDPRDLFEVLEINRDRIRRADNFTMKYLARAFREEGPATGPENLIAWLNAKITWCAENGNRYPKVVLARLKQLQRGDFILPEEMLASSPPAAAPEIPLAARGGLDGPTNGGRA